MGYPNGWNNLAYCSNNFTGGIDKYGLSYDDYSENLTKLSSADCKFVDDYYTKNGETQTLSYFGLQSAMISEVESQGIINRFTAQTDDIARGLAESLQYNGSFSNSFSNSYNFINVAYSLGHGSLSGTFSGTMSTFFIQDNPLILGYVWSGTVTIEFSDSFTDPLSIIELFYGSSSSSSAPSWLVSLADLGGTPYNIIGSWNVNINGSGVIE